MTQPSGIGRDVILIVMFALMIFLFLCNFISMGVVGNFFSDLMFGLTGILGYILPIFLFGLYLYYYLTAGSNPLLGAKAGAAAGLFLIISVFAEMVGTNLSSQQGYDPVGIYTRSAQYHIGGGLIGGSIAFVLYSLLKTVGMILLLVVLTIICIYVIGQRPFLALVREKARDVQSTRKERLEEEERYRLAHPEEFAGELEEEEYPEEEYPEEQYENPAEKRSSRGRDEAGAVRHYRGIVGNTDLSEGGNGFPKEAPETAKGQGEEKAPSQEAGTDYFENPFPAMAQEKGAGPGETAADGSAVSSFPQENRPDPFESLELHEILPEDLMCWPSGTESLSEGGMPGEDPQEVRFEEPIPDGNPQEVRLEELMPGRDPEEVRFEEPIPDRDPEEVRFEQPEKTEETGNDVREDVPEIIPEDIPVHTEREEIPPEDGRSPGSKENPSAAPAAAAGSVETARTQRKSYVFPPLDLLTPGRGASADSDAELRSTAHTLQSTLSSFGVNVKITDISQGPSVTRYEMLPDTGVKVSRIVSLSDDIKLALAATDIRIEAPIPGKSAIGIEVPNREAQPVMLRDIVDSPEFRGQNSRLSFAVGKDIAGKPVYSDIAKMPHVLIAGATGSGKSVCINTIIMSILYHARPDEVKFIMIDPKVVELSVYNGIPHLLIPVVTNPQKATAALNWAVSEMEARYRAFAEAKVRDIKAYNARAKEAEQSGDNPDLLHFMPQIVVIVDELADLMMVAKSDVETAICRLAQLARAAGIHLIIATQRPSVDVITGLIKANMPSRIAFRVSSGVDSRTILDMNGAEKLLGKGDMLFFPQGLPKPTRVQGCYVSDEEVNEVVSFLIRSNGSSQEEAQKQQEQVDALEAQGAAAGASGADPVTPEEPPVDELFGGAGSFIIEKNNASIGLLQRRYRIGFNRAARIMDQLCLAGVVSESEGTKSRNILMTPAEFEAYCTENGISIPDQV